MNEGGTISSPLLKPVRSTFSSGSGEETTAKPVKKVGDYYILEKLGEGAIAKVYIAFNPSDSTYYAIKKFAIHHLQRVQGGISQVKRELSALKRFDHPNILALKGILYNEEAHVIYLVLEYADCGSLDTCMGGALPDGIIRSLFYQVLEGLLYIHEQGLVHQDIKPSNILVRSDGRVLISDFGVGHSFQSTDMVVGSPAFQAPELLSDGEWRDPTKEDVWSLGVSLYQALFHRFPFEGETVYEIIRSIKQSHLLIPDGCGDSLRDLLQGLLDVDPHSRLSVRAAMDAPYFTDRQVHGVDLTRFCRKLLNLALDAVIIDIPVRDCGDSLPAFPMETTHAVTLRCMESPRASLDHV
jgi:serine/threonine-protein kinase 11